MMKAPDAGHRDDLGGRSVIRACKVADDRLASCRFDRLPALSGDTLTFTCFIENTSEHTLRWANELYGGEMCNLWGSAIGSGLSGLRR